MKGSIGGARFISMREMRLDPGCATGRCCHPIRLGPPQNPRLEFHLIYSTAKDLIQEILSGTLRKEFQRIH
jgi:hypothetical protein